MAELHPLLARIAGQDPAAIALICGGVTLSYGEMWAAAEGVAAELKSAGLEPGDRVALAGERTARQFVNMLGVLIAGGIYVPLGATTPLVRQARILADSGARFRLADQPAPPEVLDAPPSAEPLPAGYILFTSGSTGVPKGVRITLDNVEAFVANLLGLYPLPPAARALQVANLTFDITVQEIYPAWASGAALCVVPTAHVLMWPRYARDLDVNVAVLLPSQVRMSAEKGLLKPGSLPKLELVSLGGELVTGYVCRLLREASPDVALVNLYGPTETTVFITHEPITDLLPDHEGVPIGRAWEDQRVELHDAVDGMGELIVAGSQVSPGYWNMPEANADRFLTIDGVRFYRTGDLVRRDEAGRLVFVARADRQVKVDGYRIELDEVERAARRIAGTGDAFVVVAEGKLACFVPDSVAIDALREGLAAELPPYMIPKRFVGVAEFPRTSSGKVDLKGLAGLP